VRLLTLATAVSYRHAGLLAKMVTTLDVLSGGRAMLGIGAGDYPEEAQGLGLPFPPLGERFDLLDEAAAAVRVLLHDGSATMDGTHVTLRNARCEPRPVQPALPVWIGGAGERRTAACVARSGDGWNLPFVPPEALTAKRDALARHCAAAGRDPAAIQLGVNVVVADDDASLAAQFGPRADAVRPGSIVGTSVAHTTDALGRYVAAGADVVNVALRAPWNPGALERAAAAVAALR
jgi:alkanesulfonate monooxygenase SsuD/methylene tetrahydromethanopterin reductase-like flavin-dependent oxidoreductase (luciferase family)